MTPPNPSAAATPQSDTPEVDEQTGVYGYDDAVPADFAGKLERERDEARTKMKETAKDFETAFRLVRLENDILIAGRDAARAELAKVKAKLGEFRDCVLNQRLQLEAPRLDNDQTNAVLGLFDDILSQQPDSAAPQQPETL